ncbi:MAG: hypothetical protein FJ087_03230 [Deltaproteobacteria bacterium]|nr:hypothetical protein [Deltaproteobacteria bacterium]
MRVLAHLALPALPAILLVACAAAGSRRDAPPPPDPALSALVAAAGDHGTVLIVVRPTRRPAATATLERLLPADLETDSLRPVLAAPDAYAAFRQAWQWTGDHSLTDALPGSLPGRDPSRPIVASLFDPVPSDAVLAATFLVPPPDAPLPPLRHLVLVPATDPGAPADAISGVLRAGRCRAMAAAPEPGLVRIEVVDHGRDDCPGAAVTGREAAEAAAWPYFD